MKRPKKLLLSRRPSNSASQNWLKHRKPMRNSVSQMLPMGVETFELLQGVWVTHPRTALPVAMALRHPLIEISLVRQASDGQQTKQEMIYQYLTGPRFRQRVQAIVEAFFVNARGPSKGERGD